MWFVTDETTGLRQNRVSRDLVRLGIAAVLLVVGFLGSAAMRLFHAGQESIAERRLVQQNALLSAELDGLRSRIDTLGSSLAGLSGKDRDVLPGTGIQPVGSRMKVAGGVPRTMSLFPGSLFGTDLVTAQPAFDADVEVDALLRRARLLAFSWREAGDVIKRKYDDLASMPSILPTSGYIASVFSRNRWHPILGRSRPHLGVDIVAPAGTPVVAAARGLVSFVGRRGELGNMVEIDHGDGRVTRYAHLSRMNVRVGQHVERGEGIGRVGSTGLAVGPHLHYEVLINGRPANPRTFLEGGALRD
jgi:murein DD-endopeptidase MepM/ murein hydrolase activator NlpD